MKRSTSLLLLALLSAPLSVFSQQQGNRLVLYAITEQNGLSDNRVTCFFQDSKKFMWIGTQDGLNRFDGSVVRKYKRRENDSTTLVSNHVTGIAEDSRHHLWITTLSGLSEYDPENDVFTTHPITATYGNPTLLWDIIFYHNKLWIGSEAGLIAFDPLNKTSLVYLNNVEPDLSSKRGNNWITKIVIDEKQQFWLATHTGFWQFSENNAKFKLISSNDDLQNHELVNSVSKDHLGNLWVAYWSGGIKKYDPDKRIMTSVKNPDLLINIFGVIETKDLKGQYKIWTSGLVEIDEHGAVKKYNAATTEPDHSFDNARFYISSDDVLWLTTNEGVRIMDPGRQFFTHHYLSTGTITPQSIALFERGKNIYIGGSAKEFLTMYDSNWQVRKKIYFNSGAEIAAVLNIYRKDNDHLWLATEEGLILFDERTGSQQNFVISENGDARRSKNFITSMLIDHAGNHFVFPWRNGIWQFTQSSGTFKKILTGVPVSSGNEKKLVISDAVEDRLGNIWAADLDEGLLLFNPTTHAISKPTAALLGGAYILVNVSYEHPYVWGVRTGEVFRINVETKKIDRWAVPDEFNKSVHGFCSDLQGRLWIITSSGLLSFQKDTHEFNRFTASDGLISNEMNGVIRCLANGKILYADENYVTEFDPNDLLHPTAVPVVTITGLTSQNQNVKIFTNAAGEKSIDLNYTYNNFTFQWALPNYRNPLQNQYFYKLENIDKVWKYAGTTGQAQYASLQPGRYVFRARATTSYGVTSQNDDILIIRIRSPFWKTWWFTLLCFLVISAVIYLVYRIRLNQVLKQERLRSKISTDLHDDIGSTLSSISILGDLALNQMSAHSSSDMIREIRDNAQLLMEKMDDIVWGINPDNDSLEKLLFRMKRFASQLFEAKNIEYLIDVQPDIRELTLPMEYRQHIFLILKESINNLVKHSSCDTASIRVTFKNGILEVIIIDNGQGFDVTSGHDGNGLISIRKRAESMNAVLKIVSESGAGSTVQLQVKIK